jgi:hypothetical protein
MSCPLERLINRSRELGKITPNKVKHETILELLAKIIVEEKVLDEDAFEVASKAFAEGFNNVNKGETNETYIDQVVQSLE